MDTLSDRTKSTPTDDEIPTTDEDMENLFKWEYGDTVRGTHAKSHKGMLEYRRDIIKARNKVYRPVYINTLSTESLTRKRLNSGD